MMVRLEFESQVYDRDIGANQYAVTAEARNIAGWAGDMVSFTIETSPTTWTVTCNGETITAEIIDE